MTVIIGSDEVLKGDTFGGLVVCAARFSEAEEEKLTDLGVRDSKKISDIMIHRIATTLLEQYEDRFCVKELEPHMYNELQVRFGLTHLLNKLHLDAASELRSDSEEQCTHVVDAFPGCTAGDKQVKGAESEYIAVAAASIVARHVAMDQFARLSTEAGFKLPLGSTHVGEALERLIREGHEPQRFVKLHFKNVQAALSSSKDGQQTL